MDQHINFEMPSQDDIERAVRKARQMRSEYFARSIKAGLTNLRGALVLNRPANSKPA